MCFWHDILNKNVAITCYNPQNEMYLFPLIKKIKCMIMQTFFISKVGRKMFSNSLWNLFSVYLHWSLFTSHLCSYQYKKNSWRVSTFPRRTKWSPNILDTCSTCLAADVVFESAQRRSHVIELPDTNPPGLKLSPDVNWNISSHLANVQ